MPAAMYLTLLLSLLTVTICSGTTLFPGTAGGEVRTTNASHATLGLTSSTAVTTTPQTQTVTQITTQAAFTSPQTPTAEKTSPNNPPLNTTSSQISNETVTVERTVPSAPVSLNVTAGTSTNATSSALSDNKENYNWAANPGLVAVICIFCIVSGLLLVVITVKCIRSSTSDFERLEDMPMGKVNEASPFAQYSK